MVFLLACIYTSTWCQRQVAWNLIVMSFSKSETKYKQTAKLRIKPQSDMLRQNAMRTKPSAKTMHWGCPRTPRSCHEVTWVWTDPTRRAGGQTSPPGVLSGRTTTTEWTNIYFDILETSGMVEVIDGKLPTMDGGNKGSYLRGRLQN